MSLLSQKVARGATQSKVLHTEVDALLSRKSADLRGGSGSPRKVSVGTLLATILVGAVTAVTVLPATGNTGDGTLSLASPAFGESVLLGVYVVRCTKEGGAGVAEFSVEKPNGKELKKAADGTAYDGSHLRFTIAASGTEFALGDTFKIDVTTTDGKPSYSVVAWDPTETDGSQYIWGVSLVDATAQDGVDNEGAINALTRLGVIKADGIEWPDGLSAQDKNEALSWIDENLSIVAV